MRHLRSMPARIDDGIESKVIPHAASIWSAHVSPLGETIGSGGCGVEAMHPVASVCATGSFTDGTILKSRAFGAFL